MARRKAKKEEVYYYPRIFRYTGEIDPAYLSDPNVNSRAEGFADSPRFNATHTRQLAAEKADAGTGDEEEKIIIIDAFGDHPQMVDALTPEQELFLQPDSNPDDELQYWDDDEPDNIFT